MASKNANEHVQRWRDNHHDALATLATNDKSGQQHSRTPASNGYRKELGKMEKRICGAIHGAMRVLQGSHPRVTLEEHEYFGINLDEPTTVARFADGDMFNDGSDLVVGVALVGKGKSATVAVIKGDNFTNDIELYYTGDLDVNLLVLTQALEQLELMIAEKL